MKFYKITNSEEIHYGLQYHDGLVEDIVPFNSNPNDSCVRGGIYFSREDILAFLYLGNWIREVIVPDDALVIQDPDEDVVKWRANKIILGPRRKITFTVIKELIDEGVNIHANDDYALRWASANGHYEIVKLLLEHGANVEAYGNDALRLASKYGHYKIVELLLVHGANVNACNDYALRWAGCYRYFKIVKLLLEYGANIDVDWCEKNWNKDFYNKVMKYVEMSN